MHFNNAFRAAEYYEDLVTLKKMLKNERGMTKQMRDHDDNDWKVGSEEK